MTAPKGDEHTIGTCNTFGIDKIVLYSSKSKKDIGRESCTNKVIMDGAINPFGCKFSTIRKGCVGLVVSDLNRETSSSRSERSMYIRT